MDWLSSDPESLPPPPSLACTVVSYSIMGTLQQADGTTLQLGPLPGPTVAVLDPVVLPDPATADLGQAQGPTGALYDYLGIRDASALCPTIRATLVAAGCACYQAYAACPVVHMVAPPSGSP